MIDDEFIGESLFGLIARVQESGLKEFEERSKRERMALDELRQARGDGLNAFDLVKIEDESLEDPETRQTKLNAELLKMEQDAAQEVAAAKEQTDELLQDRFPPPPTGPLPER